MKIMCEKCEMSINLYYEIEELESLVGKRLICEKCVDLICQEYQVSKIPKIPEVPEYTDRLIEIAREKISSELATYNYEIITNDETITLVYMQEDYNYKRLPPVYYIKIGKKSYNEIIDPGYFKVRLVFGSFKLRKTYKKIPIKVCTDDCSNMIIFIKEFPILTKRAIK
jgi:hypothetical protein